METDKYKVAYNSDLIIENPADLSTFCVFYDKVVLPYNPPTGNFIELLKTGNHFIVGPGAKFGSSKSTVDNDPTYPAELAPSIEFSSDDEVSRWDSQFKVLYDEGVLERLPRYTNDYVSSFPFGARVDFNHITELILKAPPPSISAASKDMVPDSIFLREALINHLLREDVKLPGLFLSNGGKARIELYKSALAKESIQYLIPSINRLHPEQVLEVRDAVKEVRASFSEHLRTLSRNISDAVEANATQEEIQHEAGEIVREELIPDYNDYLKALKKYDRSFWVDLLSVVPNMAVTVYHCKTHNYGEL